MLLGMFLVYLISSITAVGSGLSDSGTSSIKQIISFISKFMILSLPVTFLFSQSELLSNYVIPINLFTLIIYAINLMIDSGEEQQ